ncbi:uncharacterized protein LOC143231427 [Tachypleus tridentatus]|uniref:uncharacterized protein LOC143231427 n=1 Tax=Tachypleus tridentatus TaxID=6853 RepID=UPI003FD0D221
MSKAEKRMKILEEQLLSFTSGTYPDSVPRSPKSPPPVRHPERETRSASLVAQPSCYLQGRTLVHQISAPVLPKSEQRGVTSPSYTNNATRVEYLTSPTGPPCSQVKCYRGENDLSNTIQKSLPLSTSLENITKPASPKELLHPVKLLPKHSRQSSSPDSLLQFHQQKGDQYKPAYSLSRTQSELSHHPFSRKSSNLDRLPDTVKKRKRQTNIILRGQSFSHNESSTDSPQVTPPGTPPLSDLICDGMEVVEGEDMCHLRGQYLFCFTFQHFFCKVFVLQLCFLSILV